MSTTPLPVSKYVLKPLEEEISLFDRKLAHLLKFEVFPSEEDRQAAATKLSAKRERVVRAIRELTEPSVEGAPSRKASAKPKPSSKSKPATRPRRTAKPDSTPSHEPASIAASLEVEPEPSKPVSIYAGTSLDSESELKAYRENKAKHKHVETQP